MYWKWSVGTGFFVFLATYVYAISAYGLLLGGGLGWFPAIIIAVVAGALWPVLAFATVMGALVTVIVTILAIQPH